MGKSTDGAASQLTRADVIDAAAAFVAEFGYDALSMRTLGERCRVSAMTLYRHVKTKEDLLGALADRILGEITLPTPGGSWQEQVAGVFRAIHDVLLAHPGLADVAARQHFNGRHAYEGAEIVLAALRRAGITGDEAVSAFAALTSYTIGFTQRQVNAHSEETLATRLASVQDLPSEQFENLAALGDKFLLRHSDRQFEDGLALLIGGLEARADARGEDVADAGRSPG
jgi:TetR/AcrR family tetracycline transcriptional repressor